MLCMPHFAFATTVYLTSGTTWTVPADWNSANNSIEVIGGGGGGGFGGGVIMVSGGGGGAYSKVTNVSLAPGTNVGIRVGAGGAGALDSEGGGGGDTFFCDRLTDCFAIGAPNSIGIIVGARGGGGGSILGDALGGDASSGIGTIRYSGGNGPYSLLNGAGAAGPGGNGVNGSPSAGGAGGAGAGGAGGAAGSPGAAGTEWDGTHGSGGGGGANKAAGAYGGGGGGAFSQTSGGAAGAQGLIVIIYSSSPPSCSVTADVNPLTYGGSTTLHWTSANADTSFYISSVGYVTANTSGSASVGPLATTAYNGTAIGSGGTTNCNFTLTVNAPANCALPWGGTINHGASVTAHQASGVAAGQSCVSESRSCSNGTLSGSYVYENCTVAPTCLLSASPTSVNNGQSTTLTWSSSGASSCSGTNFSGSGTSGSTSVSPSSQTTYTMSCSNVGGSTSCSGTGAGGVGALVSVSCTPAYTCTGASSNVITYTGAACSTSTIDTCVAPQFCSAGSSVCLNAAIIGSISSSPRLLPSGSATTILWSTSNASACTVSGNGNTWIGTSGTQTSAPITSLTTYTIICDDSDADATQDDYSSSVTVYMIPSWLEL